MNEVSETKQAVVRGTTNPAPADFLTPVIWAIAGAAT